MHKFLSLNLLISMKLMKLEFLSDFENTMFVLNFQKHFMLFRTILWIAKIKYSYKVNEFLFFELVGKNLNTDIKIKHISLRNLNQHTNEYDAHQN